MLENLKPFIEFKDLTLQLSGNCLLNGVTLQVSPGQCVALVGHNGAGKTTAFHVLFGIKFLTQGEMHMGEQLSPDQIGFVPERPYLNLDWSFKRLLTFHGELLSLKGPKLLAEIERVSQWVGLGDKLKKPLRTFSKGMLQKALFAQANLGEPKVLVLDEPMSGLDPESREFFKQQMQNLKERGVTLVFSSHVIEDVKMLATHVIELERGCVRYQGAVSGWQK